MSMFIEVWSQDVMFHGDGASNSATIQLIGWPFNLDLSEAPDFKLSAMQVIGGGGSLVGVFTASTSDDRILIASHGLVDGAEIRFVLDDPMSCALPTPLNENDVYFVTGARGNDFQVCATSGGPLINLTDRGTGSNEVWTSSATGGEALEQIECEQSETFVTIRFPEPIPGGETKVVRLRAKVFV